MKREGFSNRPPLQGMRRGVIPASEVTQRRALIHRKDAPDGPGVGFCLQARVSHPMADLRSRRRVSSAPFRPCAYLSLLRGEDGGNASLGAL